MRTARYQRAIRAVGRVLPDDKTLANAICAEISEACTSSLRDFLEREMRAGRLEGADPDEAAAEFRAMTVTRTQVAHRSPACSTPPRSATPQRTPAPPLTDFYGCMGPGSRKH